MEGITYLLDDENHLKAVQIDAERYGDALQDFLDGLEAEMLKKSPTVDLDVVAKRIMAKQTDENRQSKRNLSLIKTRSLQ